MDRPAADHHRDLTVLTAAVRGEPDRAVRAVNATLGMTRHAALQPLTRPRVAAGNTGFPAAAQRKLRRGRAGTC